MSDLYDRFYDREGNLIDLQRWALLFQDQQYQQLKHTDVGDFRISTIWLGIDHRFGLCEGPPIIFETMIFCSNPERELEETQYRYSTEAEALAHHEALVKEVQLLESFTGKAT